MTKLRLLALVFIAAAVWTLSPGSGSAQIRAEQKACFDQCFNRCSQNGGVGRGGWSRGGKPCGRICQRRCGLR